MGYLNPDGVLYLWEKAKARFAPKDVASTTQNGLMTSADKAKLDGVAEGANQYTHPTHTPNGSGLYKITVDNLGHVSAVTPVTKNDILALGINGEEAPTYDVATQTEHGLMSSADKTKLDGLPTNDSLTSTYAKKADITNMYRYKGSVAAAVNLPTTGLTAGDVYNIDAASSYGPAGTNVAWTGSAWDALGGLLEIEAITNAELDEICV